MRSIEVEGKILEVDLQREGEEGVCRFEAQEIVAKRRGGRLYGREGRVLVKSEGYWRDRQEQRW